MPLPAGPGGLAVNGSGRRVPLVGGSGQGTELLPA